MEISQFGEKGPKESVNADTDRRWWTLDGDAQATSISATLKRMQDSQTARLAQFTVAARLYGNLSVFAIAGQAASRYAQQYALMRDRISYNVVQSAVDTVTAKIAKNKPRPLFLTTAGSHKQQKKAKRLNRFVEGVFYDQKAYELGVEVFRDGSVAGDGLVHVYAENGKIRFERLLATELWVDEQEGLYGYPRQMHRTKAVDRLVLYEAVAAWLEGESKARRKEVLEWVTAADALRVQTGQRERTDDLVEVRESWHLPSGPEPTKEDPKGGRHVVSIAGHVLLDEPWLRDHFPFARFRWCPRLVGYWSQGGAEQVQQIQFEINKLLGVIQRSFELGGTFKIFLESTSKVPTEHLNNRLGTIVKYTGTKPEYAIPPMVQAEIFQHLLTLKNAAFEQFGVSQLSATSTKPAGLNSGVALREYNDIETDRFQVIGKGYEDFFLQLARLTIECAKGMRSLKVKAPGRKAFEEIAWREVDLAEDSYVMQCFPVSSLPRDPAGRLQTIQEYMQAGLITPRQGKRLLDFPDLDHLEDLANAPEEWLTKNLDAILDGEEQFELPGPEDDLTLAQELGNEYLAHAKCQNVEQERLEILRRWMSKVDSLQQAATQAMQAQAAAAAPQAAPEAQPTSDLIPNEGGMSAAA